MWAGLGWALVIGVVVGSLLPGGGAERMGIERQDAARRGVFPVDGLVLGAVRPQASHVIAVVLCCSESRSTCCKRHEDTLVRGARHCGRSLLGMLIGLGCRSGFRGLVSTVGTALLRRLLAPPEAAAVCPLPAKHYPSHMLDPRVPSPGSRRRGANLARRGFVFDRERYRRSSPSGRAAGPSGGFAPESQRALQDHRPRESRGRRRRGPETRGRRARSGARGRRSAAERLAIELETFLAGLPNLLHASVPDGARRCANVEVRRWGKPRSLTFRVKDHVALGERLGSWILTPPRSSPAPLRRAARRAGSTAPGSTQLMLDVHTREHGYSETYVPYLVNDRTLFGTGQLPKFAGDLFALEGEPQLRLIPTAEVSLTNLVADSILDAAALPMRSRLIRRASAPRPDRTAKTRAA